MEIRSYYLEGIVNVARGVVLSVKNWCILFPLLVNPSELIAQTSGNGRYQVFAPNTYELARYGDVPVDHSTGVPQINMPLINFSDKDINLDISLSYHASGIKVDQEATWVGLGWILNCGGVITREIRGMADGFDYSGNFLRRTSIPDYDYIANIDTYSRQVYPKLHSAANNVTDNGADVFYYNFNGRTGKFCLDNDRSPIFTKYEDFKVQFLPTYNGSLVAGSHFILTDERGFKYEFKDIENTSSTSGGIFYISAWYLSKITSPAGGVITFEYTSGGLASSFYQKRCFDQAYFAINPYNSEHIVPDQYTRTCINRDADIGGIIIKKITSSSGNYIQFNTSNTPRLDSESLVNNQLDNIVLHNWNNEQVKKFKFNYSYFEANNNRKFPQTRSDDPRRFLNYRLRLDSFHEVSSDGQLQSPHWFEYYGDNNSQTYDAYTLPYRLSPSQDHWGYYNNTYNETIFPYNPVNKPFHIDEWFRQTTPTGEFSGVGPNFGYKIANGGTREGNAESIKAGTLNRIIYPTGGYTRFDFEGHSVSIDNYWPIAGGLRVKQIETQAGSSPAIIKNYEYPAYESSEKCLSVSNAYYSWFWHETSNGGDSEKLIAFGVPAALASGNSHIARVDGSSQLMLGSGTNAVYTRVRESSPGNGSTVFEYSFDLDVTEGGGDLADAALLPGLFHSAMVDTYGAGGYPRSYIPMSLSSCIYPYPNFINNDWRRGQLTLKEVYSQNDVLLSQDSIAYTIKTLKSVPGYKVIGFESGGQFLYARYYNVGGLVKPIKEVRKTYNSDGSFIRTVKELEYATLVHRQLTDSREYTSTGEAVSTKYYYPSDYGSSLFSALNTQHIITPIDTRSYKNGKLITGLQVQLNDKGLPLVTYKSEMGGDDIPFNTQVPFSFSPKLSNVYNLDNTLRTQTVIDGVPAVYLWSYKGQYPVAQILNASYDDVKNALNDGTETFIQSLRDKTGPSVDDLSKLNSLRNNAILKNAQVTTYTFKPIVGMLNSTDLKGMTTYYEYDSFQWLRNIKDQNGNIVKNFDYHYKP